ncbi:bacterioferritin-associated ferredoxin [Kerstersia gyiorum]|uniref:Bacterioferritin-associated ferredoxin n=2 Tax=Kerstersia gyiorum TaxID=206506 RepID=A0A4Q7N078_9BURK|nr:bacterioferritin-associated ferredoxin [Kerstersia gyiorum]MCP1636742.1 bacterioferritin-associated ferredoxin [Kerstersia gyiorum]MCP1677431.1 bacterioferritin-associated ferredoxin [Kerstersia gyiorum]MCP1681565.1 bacterioferritin-associated ferredoxin [Kerstersia gyiorum]MCP1709448.1 bacterioferritin-associated ferredoxin [Kerstersia gyiorum]
MTWTFKIISLMYICICNAVTERQVRACVDSGAATLDDLQYELGVASCCGRCAESACSYLPGGACHTVATVALPAGAASEILPASAAQQAA